jgi:hypothetical protein
MHNVTIERGTSCDFTALLRQTLTPSCFGRLLFRQSGSQSVILRCILQLESNHDPMLEC